MVKPTYLTYKNEEHVAFIRINEDIETLSELVEFATTLSDICKEIQMDKQIRVVVFGSHKTDGLSMGNEALFDALKKRMQTGAQSLFLTEPLGTLDQPVIAGIEGKAVGLGLELALACDLRIASEKSSYCVNHLSYHVIPSNGGTQRLARLVGKAKALEMTLTGCIINARDALKMGLINQVVPSHELNERLHEMANEMASKAPVSLVYAKEAIDKGMDLTLKQGLRLEADLYYLMHTTGDRSEGIKAFQEKRDAHFKGE